ncbi:MAG: carbohydrate ABC transporter permease [Oscillospiraceae bacterium]|nr:carbohydrate ABC transporter permease [Oscillospiraceae bacterium]
MTKAIAVKKRKKPISSDDVFNVILTAIAVIWLIIVLYPLIYIVSCSFSSGTAVSTGRVLLWPVEPSLGGYKIVFSHRAVWSGYANTIFYTVFGSIISLIVTMLMAYPLSRRDFTGRGVIMTLVIITMFFGGGLIPSYILVSGLGLTNTRAVMLILGALGTGNMIVMRTFFQSSIPVDLLEAAKLDGISDFGYLIKIVIPLSKPVISVILLYCVVGQWNAYFTPLIYLRDRELFPLQLILQEILSATRIDATQIADSEVLAGIANQVDAMKYSLVVVATVPMLVIYPFVQKFFEKGVMIGSLKG